MRTPIRRLIDAAAAQVWAMLPSKMEEIANVLEHRANMEASEISAEEFQAAIGSRRGKAVSGGGGVAVLPLFGVISQRMGMMEAFSGGTSTETFGERFDEVMNDDSIEVVVIQVDSPGGSVSGVEELAKKIYDRRGEKKVIAVADSLMASAAYYIASAADEVVATPSALVGSIGVIQVHTEVSRAEDAIGITRTVISAGKYKAEGNPHEPLSEEALGARQEMIDEYYRMFVEAVARHRGTTASSVRSGYGQGRVLPAQQAKAAGLVDRVASFEEVLADLGVSPRRRSSATTRAESPEAPSQLDVAATTSTGLTVDFGGIARGELRWAGIDADVHVLERIDQEEAEDTPAAADQATDEGVIGGRDQDPVVAGEREDARVEVDEAEEEEGEEGAAPEQAKESPDTNAARAAEEEHAMKDQDTAAQNGSAQEGGGVATATAGEDRALERQRSVAITQLCQAHGVGDRAAGFIGSGATVEQVGQTLLGEAEQGLERMRTAPVDMSPRDAQRYSLSRAILAAADDDWSKAPLEKEVDQEIRKNLPNDYKDRGGLFVPTRGASPMRSVSPAAIEQMKHAVVTSGMPSATQGRLLMQLGQMHPSAALDSSTATAGQELVFTEAGDFIDLLRNRMKVAQLGATIISGLQGPVQMPKQDGAGTFSWVGEDPGSDVADSDATLTQVALNPKTGQSSTAYSRQLLAQGVIDVDNLVKMDLALITALGIDLAAINGSGASNQPTGILNTSGVNVIAVGANGGVPTWANIVDLETQIATDNADIGTEAILTTPGIRGLLKTTLKSSGVSGYIWDDGEVNGYPAEVSNQVPSNLTKGTGTNLHAIIQGVWSTLVMGYWGAYELVVDPYSKKKQGLIELTSFQMVGIALRYPVAFGVIEDASLS